jgi:hypothetical protein
MALHGHSIEVVALQDTNSSQSSRKVGKRKARSIPHSRLVFVRFGIAVTVCWKKRFFKPTKDMALIGDGLGS